MVNMTLALLCLNLAGRMYDNRTLSHSFELILEAGGYEDYQPRFAVFKRYSELFISIRGSTEISDFNTILDFNAVPFTTGKVHSGCLSGARWILEQLRPILANWNGPIIFTGHSMGGSIATVCAAILRIEEDRKSASAFCFGSLPCFSDDVSRAIRRFVTTFVVNRDIVPSLNPMNIKNVVEAIVSNSDNGKGALLLNSAVESFAEAMITGDVSKKADPDSPTLARIKEESNKLTARIMVNVRRAGEIGKLVNPGTVYHVIITDGVPNVIIFDENVPLENILEVFSGLRDHMINTYRQVLSRSMRAKYPLN